MKQPRWYFFVFLIAGLSCALAGNALGEVGTPGVGHQSGTNFTPSSNQSLSALSVAEQPSGIGEQDSGPTQGTMDRAAGSEPSGNVQDTNGSARRGSAPQMQRPQGDRPHLPTGLIGVSLRIVADHIGDPASLYVAHVHPEGPAQQAGIKHGDEVLTVNGTAVTGKTYEQVIQMVRGEAGTEVVLGVKREGDVREIPITRTASDNLYYKG